MTDEPRPAIDARIAELVARRLPELERAILDGFSGPVTVDTLRWARREARRLVEAEVEAAHRESLRGSTTDVRRAP